MERLAGGCGAARVHGGFDRPEDGIDDLMVVMDDQRRVVRSTASNIFSLACRVAGVVRGRDARRAAGCRRTGRSRPIASRSRVRFVSASVCRLHDGGARLESILALQRLLLPDPEASVAVQLAQPRRALGPGRPSRQVVLGQQREPRQEAQHREQAAHARASHPAVGSGTVRQKHRGPGVSLSLRHRGKDDPYPSHRHPWGGAEASRPIGDERTQTRSASVGLRRAALPAGYSPARAPMTSPDAGAATRAYSGTTNGSVCRSSRSRWRRPPGRGQRCRPVRPAAPTR